MEEAVERYQQLTASHPRAYRSQLASCLSLLGNWCDAIGQTEKAAVATAEAERLYRQLARLDSDAHTSDLAAHLFATATRATAPNDPETIPILQEAANLYRHLAHAQPDEFRPQLATCLATLAELHHAMGQWAEALSAIEQSIALSRQLAADEPDAYQPVLAATLRTMAGRLGPHARLIPINEAVEIYRGLPDTYRQNLVATLHTLALAHDELDNTQLAAAARAEARALDDEQRSRLLLQP
ncbi:hypothetical protein ACFQ9X_36860 [Catenulispora yoronensis]